MLCFFFFFKQKTAYELRISDWSSDVCSSDLCARGAGRVAGRDRLVDGHFWIGPAHRRQPFPACASFADRAVPARRARLDGARYGRAGRHRRRAARSEEHTSELQSLMRISSAVFCLKKKKNTRTRGIHEI